MRESKKLDKCIHLPREIKKAVEYKGDCDTNGNLLICKGPHNIENDKTKQSVCG